MDAKILPTRNTTFPGPSIRFRRPSPGCYPDAIVVTPRSTIMTEFAQPRLIGIDWGTTFLRAHLFGDDGAVIKRRDRPWGIRRLPGGSFPAACREVAGDWRDRWPLVPVLASGMVGSREGWHEVPYVECPADAAAIAAAVVAFRSECGTIHLVPGVRQGGDAPDVMRGEEVQIVGALVDRPQLADDSLLVLPGTHCKWARIRGGAIAGFTTYLTGELFAALRDHSILGGPGRDAAMAAGASADIAAPAASTAFLRGVRAARDAGSAGVSARLFSTRSLFLAGELPAEESLDYLSGLLVGEELRSVAAAQGGRLPRCAIVGTRSLCDRYARAFREFAGAEADVLDDTAPAGLWSIAAAATIT